MEKYEEENGEHKNYIASISTTAPRQQPPPPPPIRLSGAGQVEGTSKTLMVVGEESLYRNTRTRPYYFRSCKRVRPTNVESLPNELLSDILVRLPADYLYDRARLVCRRWYHIIHSDAFVNKQIEHSTVGLLLSCVSQWCGHPLFMTATQGRVEISVFSYKCRTSLFKGCNGLALEMEQDCPIRTSGFHYIKNPTLYIMNPATKQSLVLPPLHAERTHGTSCCVEFDASSMKYKLTLPYWRNSNSRAMSLAILTFGVDNSWRNVELEHLPEHVTWAFREGSFVTEGFMHWTSYTCHYMLTMDVETEIITVREFPRPRGYIGLRHLSTGRFLSMLVGFRDFLWEVWGMNSKTGEWRKVLPDIKLGGLLHEFASTGKDEALRGLLHDFASTGKDDQEVLVPFGWVKYPEVLAFRLSGYRKTCICYNLDTHEINSIELPYYCINYIPFVHKNSLTGLA